MSTATRSKPLQKYQLSLDVASEASKLEIAKDINSEDFLQHLISTLSSAPPAMVDKAFEVFKTRFFKVNALEISTTGSSFRILDKDIKAELTVYPKDRTYTRMSMTECADFALNNAPKRATIVQQLPAPPTSTVGNIDPTPVVVVPVAKEPAVKKATKPKAGYSVLYRLYNEEVEAHEATRDALFDALAERDTLNSENKRLKAAGIMAQQAWNKVLPVS